MANIQLNPVFEGMSKKVGDLVFYKRQGRTFVRRKGERKENNSEAQKQVRAAFSELVESWRQLGQAAQSCWDEHAKGERYTGYNAFIGINATAQREGRTLMLVPRADDFTGFSTEPGDAGEIRCTVEAPVQRVYVTLFIQKVEADTSCSSIERRDFGAGAELTLTGLEPGTYHVYAVTTDGPYDEATAVTAVAVQTVSVS